jgi:hypothetical protein
MLSAVVTSQKAVDTSIRIMDAFVGMRRYLAANAHIFQRLDRVERQQIESKLWMEQTLNHGDGSADPFHKIHSSVLTNNRTRNIIVIEDI